VEGIGLELISRLLFEGMENRLKTASVCLGRDMNRGITGSCIELRPYCGIFFSLSLSL